MKKTLILLIIIFTFNNSFAQRDTLKLSKDLFIYTNPVKLLKGQIGFGSEYFVGNKISIALYSAYKFKLSGSYSESPYYLPIPTPIHSPYLLYNGVIIEPSIYRNNRHLDINDYFFIGIKTKFKYYWYKNGTYSEPIGGDYYEVHYIQDDNTYKFSLQFIFGEKFIYKLRFINWYVGLGAVSVYRNIHRKRRFSDYGLGFDSKIDRQERIHYYSPSIEIGLNIGLKIRKKTKN